jgi:single-strand DNA-binding protein
MDPEVKEVNSTRLAKFSLATRETYKDSAGQRVTDTQWHNLIAWGKQAELVGKVLKKGNEVAIEGKLTTSNYTDKEGIKRYSTEIVVHDFQLMGRKAAEKKVAVAEEA